MPRRPDAPTARRRLTRSTVSNNTASGNGGGLSVDSGTVTLIDVSIVANHVDTGQPGVPDTYGAYGGGIEIFDMHGAIAMTNVTVTANAINDAKDKNGVAPGTTGSGAGMSIEQPAGTYVNLVVAGNTASAPIAAADPANGHRCDSFLDTTATTAANLDDDSSCFQGTRAIHTDAKLGTLGDNGGGTDTVALLDGSPAIDAGDNASAPATDQRGVTRPQPAGGRADIGAYEATPPGAATQPATAVQRATSTLNATVNPTNLATTYRFEYGTSTSYGSTTPSAPAGSDSADHPVAADIAGLTAGTTYHFRVVATSGVGTTTGADRTFTTASDPGATTTPTAVAPVVVTGASTAVTQHTAVLNGTVDPGTAATSYSFGTGRPPRTARRRRRSP